MKFRKPYLYSFLGQMCSRHYACFACAYVQNSIIFYSEYSGNLVEKFTQTNATRAVLYYRCEYYREIIRKLAITYGSNQPYLQRKGVSVSRIPLAITFQLTWLRIVLAHFLNYVWRMKKEKSTNRHQSMQQILKERISIHELQAHKFRKNSAIQSMYSKFIETHKLEKHRLTFEDIEDKEESSLPQSQQ